MLEQTKVGTNYTGFYRGKVLAHSDGGRCKIFWPGVSDEKFQNSPDMLPDAEQASPLFASAQEKDGLFFYPQIGSIVWGFFENGDVNFPVYFASSIGGGLDNVSKIYGSEVKGDLSLSAYNGEQSYNTAVLHLGSLKITFNGSDSSMKVESSIDVNDPESKKKDRTESSIVFGKNGLSISSNKTIKIEARDIEIEASKECTAKANSILNLYGGGKNSDGSDVPGRIKMISNNNTIATKGGSTFILGEKNPKTTIVVY